ncbi:hypothetical protein SAMN06265348_108195 [Pedobacter westerhofensis]|uniref:DUF5672 domain-containing protein n=1 Tax=Pedobacter westerhofensis TaxID=425512 RepID=A0A521EJY9_9SPHI|nr:DUF5672 family protein [Pedobacter westerhofensis]SMO83771.1 hypothetical protein SAMN06265348_108195 [Pedobacter westerhofensis]
MDDLVSIIIPLYKSELSPLEEISISQCFKILSSYKIIALKPQKLEMVNYKFPFNEIVSFGDEYFESIAGYNRLMLSSAFYEKFLKYKFILIYQPDAFVFRDDLAYWCNQGYDYIGAPWLRYTAYPDVFKKIKNHTQRFLHTKLNLHQPDNNLPTEIQLENRVGNGGFSLRNTKRFYEVCIRNKKMIAHYNSRAEHQFNEDVFFGLEANRKRKQLNIPNYKKAIYFSMNDQLEFAFKLTEGKLPFGCHAWNLYVDFWAPVMASASGVDIKNI